MRFTEVTGKAPFTVQVQTAEGLKTIPLLIVASIWYLIVTTVLSVGQYYIERRFGRTSEQVEASD